jgi:plasmid stabilization system protein ParE
VEREFYETFAPLGRMPEQDHQRTDLTKRPVRFFPLHSYLMFYRPNPASVFIVAVVHGSRNLKRIIGERSL